MSFAQFKDNVFDQNKPSTSAQTADSQSAFGAEDETTNNTSSGVPSPGEHEEGPGNPGPVPIDGSLTFLLLTGFVLILYFQHKNKKINI